MVQREGPGNAKFVSEFIAKYGGTPGDIPSDAPEAYSVGEVVDQAAQKAHSIANSALIPPSTAAPIRGSGADGVRFAGKAERRKLPRPVAERSDRPRVPAIKRRRPAGVPASPHSPGDQGGNVTLVLEAVVFGILTGGVYALMASGLTLIFGVMRIINVGHGALVILGAYLSFALLRSANIDPFLSLIITMPAMFALGVVLQLVFIRPLKEDREALSVLVTYAMALGIEGLLGYLFTNNFVQLTAWYETACFRSSDSASHTCTCSASACVWRFSGASSWCSIAPRLAAAVRATMLNRTAAQLVGVDVDRVSAIAFGIGVATAAAGGVVFGMTNAFNPGSHYDLISRLLTIIVLGGLGSLRGAVIGAVGHAHRRGRDRGGHLAGVGELRLLRDPGRCPGGSPAGALRHSHARTHMTARPPGSRRKRARFWSLRGRVVAPRVRADPATINVAVFTAMYIGLATAWNIMGGYTGYVSLGHAAFFGFGPTRSVSPCPSRHPAGYEPFLFVPVAGLLTVLLALPDRMDCAADARRHVCHRHDRDDVHDPVARREPRGLTGRSGSQLPGAAVERRLLRHALLLRDAAHGHIALGISWWIRRSKFGLGLLAIRDDEDKALAVGVPAHAYKLTAFVISAALVGMIGAVYGYYVTYIYPQYAIDPLVGISLVLMVFLGGLGTLWGPVLGAVILEPAQLWLAYNYGASRLYLVFYAAVFLVVILLLPRGIVPSVGDLLKRIDGTTRDRSLRHRLNIE